MIRQLHIKFRIKYYVKLSERFSLLQTVHTINVKNVEHHKTCLQLQIWGLDVFGHILDFMIFDYLVERNVLGRLFCTSEVVVQFFFFRCRQTDLFSQTSSPKYPKSCNLLLERTKETTNIYILGHKNQIFFSFWFRNYLKRTQL